MDTYKLLSTWLRFWIFLPGAASCYLAAKDQMRFTPAKTVAICAAVLIPYSAVAALLYTLFAIDVNRILVLSFLLLFFLYRRTVILDLPRVLAIYVGVCAIETFPAQFACSFDAALYPASGADRLSIEAALFQFVLSCLLLVFFVFPATQKFAWAVNNLNFPKVWYSTVVLSSAFLAFNMLAVPRSYATLHTGRMYWLFPVFEAGALAVLVTVYVLFYQIAVVILEHARLKERSQLLEMQSHQYFVLQEHIRQTAKLRHDFRHSVRLVAALAERGDIDSIRAHIAEYEVNLDRYAVTSYCKNAAINALFCYYHEMAVTAGIALDWNIELPEPLPYSELDMAALFGNLIENAIAGCKTVSRDARYFCLTAETRHTNMLYVVSTNSFNGKASVGKDGYRSTKHSGIDLASITVVAEKYGGYAKVSNSSREFFVDVLLKIPGSFAN